MSDNKGKDGEMRVLRVLSHIVESVNNCDVTRHTNTNTADGGADLVLEHPKGLLSYLEEVASGGADLQMPDLQEAPRVKTRIDVKTTDNKISPDTVIKFGGDIRRNPDCLGHVLMGGNALSPQAEAEFKKIQEAHAEAGKEVVYIPNSGVNNLETHYLALPMEDADVDK